VRDAIDPASETLISLGEAAGMIPVRAGKTVSVRTLRRWASNGRLQTIRAGDRIVLTSREAVWRMLSGAGPSDRPAPELPTPQAPTASQAAIERLNKAGVAAGRSRSTRRTT
jgi:hypothetical protein